MTGLTILKNQMASNPLETYFIWKISS